MNMQPALDALQMQNARMNAAKKALDALDARTDAVR
jgi:hypothetical protein